MVMAGIFCNTVVMGKADCITVGVRSMVTVLAQDVNNYLL